MANRQIINGMIWDIDIILDKKHGLLFEFSVLSNNTNPPYSFRFRKHKYEIESLEKLIEFFKAKNWNQIEDSSIRLMIDDFKLRAIGRMDEELWLEVFPWNFTTEDE